MSSSASSGTERGGSGGLKPSPPVDKEVGVPVVVEIPKGSRNVYKQLEDKTVEVFGWRDAATGRRVLDDAIARGAGR